LSQPSELKGAVKVTGQKNAVRYGFLAASEEDTKLHGMLDEQEIATTAFGRDFGIARVFYENVENGGRYSIGWLGSIVTHPAQDAIVNGLDAHLLSSDKKWLWDMQLMRSDVDQETGNGGFIDMAYNPGRGIEHKLSFDWLDDKLDINDLGFLRRNDIVSLKYRLHLTETNLAQLKQRNSGMGFFQGYNTEGNLVGSGVFFGRNWTFMNRSQLFVDLDYSPKRWDDRNSDGNGLFRIAGRWNFRVFFESDSAKEIAFGVGGGMYEEDLGDWSNAYAAFIDWRPNHRFSMSLAVDYKQRDHWLLHQEDRDFATFEAEDWQPKLEVDFFLTSRQQLRITAQWAGIKASEQDKYLVPLRKGDLKSIAKVSQTDKDTNDFSISRLTFQFRYKWEIAPLSDLFVVYTRGSNLDSAPDEKFGTLLSDAWNEKIVDVFTIKLRYRMGS
jgi:hypothetical protein